MNVLVVGSGAREHAIVWKLATGQGADQVYCVPGNGGTALLGQNLAMPIDTEAQCDQVAGWAFNNGIGLVIVGPEVPLRHGIADSLTMLGVPVFGPTQAAARLEWSKSWARDFMKRHDIPAPEYRVVHGMDALFEALHPDNTTYPCVIKADGLAAGKGAVVVADPAEAQEELSRMRIAGALPPNDAEVTVVIEEFLEGFELSALAFTDGKSVAMMPPACDYKRLLDGDQGPLTGGMGAYTPTARVTPEMWEQVEREIIRRAVDGMASEGTPYRGVLYAGLMVTEQGPKVLEFNCRFGDPEAQVLIPRLKTPLEDIALAVAKGDLSSVGPIEWSDDAAVGVVIASDNYPAGRAEGLPVSGLDALDEGVLVFHAGTQVPGIMPIQPEELRPTSNRSIFRTLFPRSTRQDEPLSFSLDVVATGGRLLTVVGRGGTLAEARGKVYSNVGRIRIPGTQYRRDIGLEDAS
ncbi:MAG TPA: phosphoribosylamine--glycine ligase [Chloroflexia bacterium]|nr:phosphoribosylamine--glycine ligase [Chloroflexia bacterium]